MLKESRHQMLKINSKQNNKKNKRGILKKLEKHLLQVK